MPLGASNATTAGADITEADLRRIMDGLNAAGDNNDAGIIAGIHRCLGDGRPVLEVRLDGRPYLSMWGDGKILVLDMRKWLLPSFGKHS